MSTGYRYSQSEKEKSGGVSVGNGKKVVVAMSGGVDSSVAALLLKEQGYEVMGVALQTTDYSKYRNDNTGGSCCSVKDMDDARKVADILDIPFYVLDTEKTFDTQVVDYFVTEYLQGKTPNPCVMCNTKVKFNHLFKKAMDLGADFVATGHYAKISKEPGLGYVLWRSTDTEKDQTYFLYNLTQRQLEKTLFPVGHLKKEEVRKLAERFKLPVSTKPDSQEICFVPSHDYSNFIENRTAPTLRPSGYIVTTDNRVLGEHTGVFKYTIGQRKGLTEALETARRMNLANPDDLHVIRIDPIRNLVVLGYERDLHRWGLIANKLNWIVKPDLRKTKVLQIRVRHRHAPADAEVRMLGDHSVEIRFFEPQRAVTPGQAVVIYDQNMVIGGGWIAESIFVAESERPRVAESL
jgi:tRNA-specific 2-thiouridylase